MQRQNMTRFDNLLNGPDLLNNLVGILLRFRGGKIGIMADVEQMFHQIGVCEEDRDSLRFLWRDLDETRPPDEYQMTVHVFGAVDSPCCANYALQRTALDQSVCVTFTWTIFYPRNQIPMELPT